MLIKVYSIILLSISVSIALTSSYRVVCYYGTWAGHRHGNGKFVAEDIDAHMCTHLIYSFAGLDNKTSKIRLLDPHLDLGDKTWRLNMIQRALNLRLINTKLKVLIAVGGANEGSDNYSVMASNNNTRATFVQSVVEFLKKYKFDGMDLDWEHPTKSDNDTFPLLLKELKKRFELERKGWLLSIAVGVGPKHLTGFSISKVSEHVHFINLMTYDLHGSGDNVTGHHTQMFKMPTDTGSLNLYNRVMAWINGGAPPLKLNLGTAFYGRTYTTKNESNDGSLGQPTTGNGNAGNYTTEPGLLGFNEICKMLKEETGWQQSRNQYVQAPVAYKGNQFVAFDDVQSIIAKSQWAKCKLCLGGGMTWSVDTDDFLGTCFNNQKFPLLKALHDTWMGFPATSSCRIGAFRTDANDCSKYYICGPTSPIEYLCNQYIDGNLLRQTICRPRNMYNTWTIKNCGNGCFFNMISKKCELTSC